MTLFSKFFGKPASPPSKPQEPLVPVPIPALGALLLNIEKQKGTPLLQAEVLDARDKAVCIMLPLSEKVAMEEKRGYRDIDPENVWEEWLLLRAEVSSGQP
jgi:hypothetical protein